MVSSADDQAINRLARLRPDGPPSSDQLEAFYSLSTSGLSPSPIVSPARICRLAIIAATNCTLLVFILDFLPTRMLRSTYAPPPPLPPGWSQHKAPSGLSTPCIPDKLFTDQFQATFITTTPKPNNRPTRDLSLLHLNPSPFLPRQKALSPPHFLPQTPCRRSRLPHMDLRGRGLEFLTMVLATANSQGVFAAAKAIRTVGDEDQKIGRNQSIRFLGALLGCW